jgi:hypothetical protein
MRRPGGIRRVKASHQFRGHRMDQWHGRSTAAGRSADRNGGLLARPGRIARRFGAHGEDTVADTARALHAAGHRDQRFPGSSGHGDAHRPLANSPVRRDLSKCV